MRIWEDEDAGCTGNSGLLLGTTCCSGHVQGQPPPACWPVQQHCLPCQPASLAGRLPFEGKDKPEIKRNITSNNLAPLPSFLTPQCQSFIKAMLTYGVDERPSCAQLLQHPYITMYCTPPAPKPAALPNVIALHAYSPGAGGPGEAGRSGGWAGPGQGACQLPRLPCRLYRGIHTKKTACAPAWDAVPGGAAARPATAAGPNTASGERRQWGDHGRRGSWNGGSSFSASTTGGGGASAAPSIAQPSPSGRPDVTYADALRTGGRVPAPGDDMRSPRTPGGSHVPVTVGRNAAASAQHSPTILAGGASPHDPFTSPLRPADHSGAASGVPRKIRCVALGAVGCPLMCVSLQAAPTKLVIEQKSFCAPLAALSSSPATRPQQHLAMPR